MKKLRIFNGLFFAFLLLPVLAAQPQAREKPVFFTDAVVLAVPPGAVSTAGYITLYNESENEFKLIEIISDIAEVVEIHAMTREDGAMRMTTVQDLVIPPNAEFDFKKEGLHVMLIGLRQPVLTGDQVKMTLYFDNGSRMMVLAQVVHPEEIESEMNDEQKGSHKGSHMEGHGR